MSDELKILGGILLLIAILVSAALMDRLWGPTVTVDVKRSELSEPACCKKLEEAKKQHQEQLLLLSTEHDAYQIYFQQELDRLNKRIGQLEKLLEITKGKSI